MPAPIDYDLQLWWEISCIYEGEQMWGISFGDTVEEAGANFKRWLPAPEHAIILGIKPLPECTGVDALSALSHCA